MLATNKLAILLELSLSLINIGVEEIDYKKTLKTLLRILNCSSARIYFFIDANEKYQFELISSLPKIDKEMDQFLKDNFFLELGFPKTLFESLIHEFPKSYQQGHSQFHIFHMYQVGLIVLKTVNNNEFDILFLKTLNQIFEKLSLAIEKNRAQNQIRQTEHFVNIGQVTSGIAHEINNPVTIILGINQIMNKVISEKDFEKIQELNTKINRAAQRVGDIVKGLKSLSRDESELPLEIVPIGEILSDSEFFIQSIAEGSPVKIIFPENFEQNDFNVLGRPVQLSQVVINLIKNSIEAIYAEADPWVKISLFEENDFVCLRVTDCGQGISKELQKSILTPFFTTKKKGVGTGLGLSLSKKILESQGGTLFYDSECENTSFVIKIKKYKA